MSWSALRKFGSSIASVATGACRVAQTGAAVYRGLPRVLSRADTIATLISNNILLDKHYLVKDSDGHIRLTDGGKEIPSKNIYLHLPQYDLVEIFKDNIQGFIDLIKAAYNSIENSSLSPENKRLHKNMISSNALRIKDLVEKRLCEIDNEEKLTAVKLNLLYLYGSVLCEAKNDFIDKDARSSFFAFMSAKEQLTSVTTSLFNAYARELEIQL